MIITQHISQFSRPFWYNSVKNAEVIPFSTAALIWSCLACSLETKDRPTRYSFTLCQTNQMEFKVVFFCVVIRKEKNNWLTVM